MEKEPETYVCAGMVLIQEAGVLIFISFLHIVPTFFP